MFSGHYIYGGNFQIIIILIMRLRLWRYSAETIFNIVTPYLIMFSVDYTIHTRVIYNLLFFLLSFEVCEVIVLTPSFPILLIFVLEFFFY